VSLSGRNTAQPNTHPYPRIGKNEGKAAAGTLHGRGHRLLRGEDLARYRNQPYGRKGPRQRFRRNTTSTLSWHRLQHGLQGYLILFDPHTLVLDWQVEIRPALSLLVVLKRVQAFHRSPLSTLGTITTSVSTSTPRIHSTRLSR